MKNPRPQKKKPSEIQRDPLREIPMSEEDWDEFHRGVTFFNSGKFWNAHEAWEQVWLRHAEDERLFFQGLIQLAAAYHQLLLKKSVSGMVNNFDKAAAKLEVFQPEYLGVHVKPLLKFIEEGKKEARRIREDLSGFNPNLVPKLQFHRPSNPDLIVEIADVCRHDGFLEGVKLFNNGYHWEAHEVWEDVWREKEGDAKSFLQAFVQAASAFSFLKLCKPTSAVYLFEKSIEKFREFEQCECPVRLTPFIQSLDEALARARIPSGNGKPAHYPRIELIS